MQIKKETQVNGSGVATAAQMNAINAQAKATLTAEGSLPRTSRSCTWPRAVRQPVVVLRAVSSR